MSDKKSAKAQIINVRKKTGMTMVPTEIKKKQSKKLWITLSHQILKFRRNEKNS